jgi:hypothetical protein
VAPGKAPVVRQFGLDGVELVLADNGRDLGDEDPVGGRRHPGGPLAAYQSHSRLSRPSIDTASVDTARPTGIDGSARDGVGEQVIDR